MKTLYLKQKALSFTDRYKVFDEKQKVVYHCEGQFFSFSHKMDLYDTLTNKPLFTLKKKIFSFLPTYQLFNPQGEEVATIHKRFTILKHKLDIESKFGQFTIDGDFLGHAFTISANGKNVATFVKKWISWGDSYEIQIYPEENLEFYVALVLMIDNCLHDGEQTNRLSFTH
jgi:uncharacterized protein YxjI